MQTSEDSHRYHSKDGQAEYIVTGDKPGLLKLGAFEDIPIVRLQAFLDILTQS